MIKVESLHIQEVRGIRDLTLELNRDNLVVSGPNGSGKSGIVDALEFGLTGEITRLSGKGSGGLTIQSHGPHVDKRDYPDPSYVRLRLYIPKLDKTVTITRRIKKPRQVVVEPDDDDVKAILAEVQAHPEITLSRREIIKLILTEATRRSQDVQTLLKLDEIDQTRGTLKTSQNKLGTLHKSADSQVGVAEDSLRRHLDLPELSTHNLLAVVNAQREVLRLPVIDELGADTALDAGVVEGGKEPASKFNRKTALRDLESFAKAAESLAVLCKDEAAAAVKDLQKLEEDPDLFAAFMRRDFVQTGLKLIDGPRCPLCDTEWEIDHLREHLQAKLAKSKLAKEVQQRLLNNGREIAKNADRLRGLVDAAEPIARAREEEDFRQELAAWSKALGSVSEKVVTVEGLTEMKDRLAKDWVASPSSVADKILALKRNVEALPDDTPSVAAQTFLAKAADRLDALRRARREVGAKKKAWDVAKVAYKAYCDASESALTTLYQQVEGDFSSHYRKINQDDEGEFNAKLQPSDGKLDLSVDFYKRGMFPPGAYHSEGHQDGMGVCLYLALMKQLLGDQFTFAVLDDVVMSVDSQHRKQFCQLLKSQFPDTQFVITTHDQLWAQQMRSVGLVTAKSSLAFYGWSIDTGPLVEEVEGVWEEIAANLAKNKVPTAAALLRRHLEFASRQLAGEIAARPPFRPDGNYDLGDLLPSVVSRQLDLLGKAAKAANSWDDNETRDRVSELRSSLADRANELNLEQWAVNKALHYNEWANFSREDFEPVVATFRALLEEFRCDKCESWTYSTPKKGPADALRCSCSAIHFNLKTK